MIKLEEQERKTLKSERERERERERAPRRRAFGHREVQGTRSD